MFDVQSNVFSLGSCQKRAPESYNSIDLTRKAPKEEEFPSYITSVVYFKSEKIEEKQEEKEELSPEQNAKTVRESYASIDLSRKFLEKEEECSYVTFVCQPKTHENEEKKVEESSPERKFRSVQESYESIDLRRKAPRENEEESAYITSSIYVKPEKVEKKKEVEEKTLEQKNKYRHESYNSIDLRRKTPKEETCSYITSSIYTRSEKVEKKQKSVELTPEQKIMYGRYSYDSIDLGRKVPKEDEWINYLDDPESEVKEEQIPKKEEEVPAEQETVYAKMSYDSIDLTKRERHLDQEFQSNDDVQNLAAIPEDPKSENVAEPSESVSLKSPESSKVFVQPPAKIQKKYRRTDTTFVMKPVKEIEGDTPQRPFPKELYWNDPAVSGTASEVFAMLFKSSSQAKLSYTNANFAAPATAFKILEEARQKALQTSTATPKNQQKPQKQRKVLESVQNTLWLVHSYKRDAVLEQTLRSTIQKFSCTRGDDGRLRILEKNGLSIVWNLTQRESDWHVKPVFIDGLSILDMVSGIGSTGLPVLQVQLLTEILLHLILDGHQVTLFLPEAYTTNPEKIDDQEVFKFLCTLDMIKFVNQKNRKAVGAEVLKEAEKTAGIICSNSEDLHTVSSIQCFPVLQKISNSNYTVNTVFAQKASGSNRLYSKETAQMDTSIYQMILERQAFLVSSLIHVTRFHGQRQQQIEVFLTIINRFLPEILPKSMEKSKIITVGESIGMLQAGENLESWPIFSK
ncbi:hypothetical protein CAEBREN_22641 [Caenorhabditis brenneri]|uniref:RNase NYN domain-containing protein n=1 Tax=Caenorhabditis brenneri TaxID=135651 RepID=G0P353_CAEBE|nr:hypothetical protein CAEBREN_22641 [Caenorhabditis brenneri]